MQAAALRSDERIGLAVAVALHVALAVVLLMQPAASDPPPMPERMTVSLSEDVGLVSQAPAPVPDSRAAIAPTLSDVPSSEPVTEPVISPAPVPQPTTAPRPQPTSAPRPRATSAPRPQPTAAPRPRQTSRPAERPARQPAAKPSAAPTRSGGSRIGADFLPGSGSSTTSEDTRLPASQIGASAQASIVQAIARQLRPHWQGKAPSGADAEQLITVLAFDLNPDGSLKGRPRVVSQDGITPSNEAQKERHAEVAIRAVQLAAPFDLPDEYYNAWKSIRGARFDRNLSR